MAQQFLPFPDPASKVSGDDTVYVLSSEWSTNVAGSWTGVRWFPPDDLVAGFNYYIVGYTVADSGFLQSKLIHPVSGSNQIFNFDTPIAVVPETRYAACVLTKHYSFTTTAQGWVWPFTDGADLTGFRARFVETLPDTEKFPSVTNVDVNYHIGPVLGTGGVIPPPPTNKSGFFVFL